MNSTCVFESVSHKCLNEALLSARNRFRCFDVSERFIAAGSSSGDVFIFDRNSQQLSRRISVASAKIDRIALNPVNDCILCIATNRGALTVFEYDNGSNGVQVLYTGQAHLRSLVRQLVWSSAGTQLIAGDSAGVVSITDLYSMNDAMLFDISPTNVLQLDSVIVQLDATSTRILISTRTATYLCDVSDRRFTKVGKKSRNGDYGACFRPADDSSDESSDSVFCARPGARLWKVNQFGEVECTLNFKHEGSTSIDHSPISLEGNWRQEREFDQKVTFGKMLSMQRWLISFSESALFFLDVGSSEIPRIVWQTTGYKESLQEAFISDSSLFLTLKDGTLLEWQACLISQPEIIYLLSTPEQRLAVICRGWTEKHFECLDIIRRRQSVGKELLCRNMNLHLTLPRPTRTIYLTTTTVVALLRFYEGIMLSSERRWFSKNVIVLNLPSVASREQQNAPAAQNETPKAVLTKEKLKIREAHQRLLCEIINRCQKELADSMLVELNASLWSPHVLQEKHYIDRPLQAWGLKTRFDECCDSCGENLIIHGIEEDLQFHYCGHRFHVSCNDSDRLCCVCMQP